MYSSPRSLRAERRARRRAGTCAGCDARPLRNADPRREPDASTRRPGRRGAPADRAGRRRPAGGAGGPQLCRLRRQEHGGGAVQDESGLLQRAVQPDRRRHVPRRRVRQRRASSNNRTSPFYATKMWREFIFTRSPGTGPSST